MRTLLVRQLLQHPHFTLKWFCAGHLSAMAWFQHLSQCSVGLLRASALL